MSTSTRALLDACRTYREAHARYAFAFARGDVDAVEEAFSRMQEIGRAFRDGACWAERRNIAGGRKAR
ncbi:MAG: hypothetical protein ACREHV_03165 [Rhizomicrobium sp.]